MKLILCVEDEPDILENNRKALEDNGYEVLTAENLDKAREILARNNPDAIVLDIMLPDGLGLDLLKELRSRGNRIPILLLTAWDKPSDVARGLSAGANDYLSKPFDYNVLLARIDAMFRNVEQIPEKIQRGVLTMDVLASQAFVNGEDMLLTKKEFALLLLFVNNEGDPMSCDYLYEKVWKAPYGNHDRTLKTHISNLRKRLKYSGYTIKSVRGAGYCLMDYTKTP